MSDKYFNPEFVRSLSVDTDDRIIAITREYQRFLQDTKGNVANEIEAFFEIEGAIATLNRVYKLEIKYEMQDPSRVDTTLLMSALGDASNRASNRVRIRDLKKKREAKQRQVEVIAGESKSYIFEQEELKLLLEKIAELRTIVLDSEHLNGSFKRRFAGIIEDLQREINQEMYDLRGFWSVLGEACSVIDQLGESAEKARMLTNSVANIVLKVAGTAHIVQFMIEQAPKTYLL